MIKFLRKIRQQMINENKVSRYILYAIGEIALVIIGILIALQINNNNELKRERAFEVKMLHEIRNELIQDTMYFNMIKERAEIAQKGAQVMVNIYDAAIINKDSILREGMSMFKGFQFSYHKGAYEAIKSTGIDKISNDSVRMFLTDMYDFVFPRNASFIAKAQEKLNDNTIEYFLTMDTLRLPDNQLIISGKPPKNIPYNEDILKTIRARYSSNTESIGRLNSILRRSEFLLGLLDRELQIDDVLTNTPKNKWKDND